MTEIQSGRSEKIPGLKRNQFRWDKLCPRFISCFPHDRSNFAGSEMIQRHELILQDRAFSIGPAVFAQLLDYLELEGDVVQTHICSPRSTAYLASLLRYNDRVRQFMVFGAGNNKKLYQSYMKEIGVDNIKIFAENFVDVSPNIHHLDTTIGVYACPPCSYSGIGDPIDLICSRGGDLSMLEMLSESEMTNNGKQKVAKVLEEQRNTLKKAMSRPHTQFILYGTYSIVGTENQDMVNYAIEHINKNAKDKHIQVAKEKARLEALAALAESSYPMFSGRRTTSARDTSGSEDFSKLENKENIEPKTLQPQLNGHTLDLPMEKDIDSESEAEETKSRKRIDSLIPITFDDEDFANIEIPLTDMFETVELPDICQNRDGCMNFEELGCYLTLIRRKEIVHLDSKYLIKIAELRGIFGDNNAVKKPKSKAQKRAEREAEKAREALLAAERLKKMKHRGSNLNLLLDRINAPTVASIKRSHHQGLSIAIKRMLFFHDGYVCKRHACHHSEYDGSIYVANHIETEKTSKAREWWFAVFKYLQRIKLMLFDIDLDIASLIHAGPLRLPFLPPFALDRISFMESIVWHRPKVERVIYPVMNNVLEFDSGYQSEDK